MRRALFLTAIDTAMHAETKVDPGKRVRFTAGGVQTYSGRVTCHVASVQRTIR